MAEPPTQNAPDEEPKTPEPDSTEETDGKPMSAKETLKDPKRIRKLSRKDVAKLSTTEFTKEMRVPFRRLLSYVVPYKGRFLLGIVFGILYGLFGAAMMFGMRFTFETLLPHGAKAEVVAPANAAAPSGLQLITPNPQPKKGQPLAFESTPEFSPVPNDLYKQLGVEPDASMEEIEASFKQITLDHPVSDKPKEEYAKKDWENWKRAREAGEAFRFLGNAEARAKYDENTQLIEEAIARGETPTPELLHWTWRADVTKAAGVQSFTIPVINKEITIPKPDLSTSTGIWTAVMISMLIPIMMGMRGLLQYVANYALLWVGIRVQHDLRSQLFTKLTQHSLRFYSKQKTGELIQTVFNQTRMAATAGTELSTSLVKHPVSIIALVVVLFIWDWRFAISALVVFPLCMLPVIIISNKVRKAGGKEEEQAGMVMVAMQESFAGIRTVKSYAREDYEQKRFNFASEMMNGFIMRWRKAMEIVSPMVETVASVGIAVALVYAKATGMTAGQFLMMFMALIAIYPHAKALSRVQIMLQKCLIASTKVFEIMDTPLEIDDAPDARDIIDPQGGIRLKDVTFGYVENQPAVRDLDITFEAGKTYALVGPSGSGKTTIFSLLMRFYDPDEGGIEYDGVDYRKLKQSSLRDNIGIVNQDTFLFHDTIENNIRYGKLDATEEEIVEAAKKANAHDFIMEQPNGYQTKVGDQGSTLSGGQQQRISIARTILRDAPVLLLDEAYSALDTESEKIIQDAMTELSEGKTVIAIAHRLSTVLDADQILVMNQGWVEARSDHEDLLQHCELYRRLYQLQFEGEASIAAASKKAAAAKKKAPAKKTATKKAAAKKKTVTKKKTPPRK